MAGGLVMEAARATRRRHAAGRQRAQRHPPVPARPRRRRSAPADPDRVGRPVPRPAAPRRSAGVTAADALKHPTWQMGRKITIDSATLMNKGLEVIEAHWLFGMPADADRRRRASAVDRALDGRAEGRLDHRAARRHRHAAADSVRVLVSGSLGRAGAVARPDAVPARSSSTSRPGTAFRACGWPTARSRPSGSLPIVLNAANEVAVASFLEGRLRLHRHSASDRRRRWTRTTPGRSGRDAGRCPRESTRWARMHAAELARRVSS